MNELALRRISRDGREIAVFRVVETLGGCRVEAELPGGLAPAPYLCADPRDALAFLTEAVETFTVLGCDAG